MIPTTRKWKRWESVRLRCYKLDCRGIGYLAIAVGILCISNVRAAQIARSWNSGSGNWSAGTNWEPIGVPEPTSWLLLLGDAMVIAGRRRIDWTVVR